jgi:hypothetical protein
VAKRVKRPIQHKVELAECGGMHLAATLLLSSKVHRQLPGRIGPRSFLEFVVRNVLDRAKRHASFLGQIGPRSMANPL